MEADALLNMGLRSHRLCLILTFINRIQRTLDRARVDWNLHRMRTQKMRSPRAAFAKDRVRLHRAGMWPGDGEDVFADIGEGRGQYEGELAWAQELMADFDFDRDDGLEGMSVFLDAVDLFNRRAPDGEDYDLDEY